MEIDLTSIIVGFVALSFFFVPIGYYQISEKRNLKKLNDSLIQLALKHQLNLTKFEVWGGVYGIGIDEISKKLIYFKQDAIKSTEHIFSFSEIKKVKLINTSKTLNNGSQKFNVTDKVGLSFQLPAPNTGEKSIEFYSYASGKLMNNEIALSEKWKKIIQDVTK